MKKLKKTDSVDNNTNRLRKPVDPREIRNNFPVKVEGPDLKAAGNEVGIESVEIAHEGLSIEDD